MLPTREINPRKPEVPTRPTTTRRFGRYRLIAKLAVGGMADIYLGARAGLGGFEKLVVIKCLSEHLGRQSKFVDMFLDEARLAAQLNHPNLIQIFDSGKYRGRYYMAMEYLSGECLARVLAHCRQNQIRLSSELSAAIILQAAEGLDHAHKLVGTDGAAWQVVHRDISPQNIFVLFGGGVKVVDFGVAKAVRRDHQTDRGTLKGKFAYMSPEQVRGERLDARSDVFSLGIVLWECLTGRRLYGKSNDIKALQVIPELEVPGPDSVNPDVPKELSDITLEALRRDRHRRLQSALELRRRLAAFLKGATPAADSMTIGHWMQENFSGRMAKKRELIESALTIDEYASGQMADFDTGSLITEQSTDPRGVSPRGMSEDFSDPISQASRRRLRHQGVMVALLVTMLVAGGAWLLIDLLQSPRLRPRTSGADPAATQTRLAIGPEVTIPPRRLPEAVRLPAAKPRKRPRRISFQPAKKRKGTVDVACLPWCRISIDGRPLEEVSPLKDHPLPAGEHLVEVTNPPSGARDHKKIRIEEGKPTRLRFRLPGAISFR